MSIHASEALQPTRERIDGIVHIHARLRRKCEGRCQRCREGVALVVRQIGTCDFKHDRGIRIGRKTGINKAVRAGICLLHQSVAGRRRGGNRRDGGRRRRAGVELRQIVIVCIILKLIRRYLPRRNGLCLPLRREYPVRISWLSSPPPVAAVKPT